VTTAFSIWTLGHSNLPIESFLERLECYEIAAIADVRRFPGSRRQSQYSKDVFPSSLAEHGITYRWFEALGGRRRPSPGSSNTAWRNTSFRGYADYMGTEEFQRALEQLLEFAREQRTALLCAEVLWWRCHRALIADVLRLRGVQVIHVLDLGKTVEHPFTSPARVVEGQLTYSA
jgi:uncharacterized protein (DUF488 family)